MFVKMVYNKKIERGYNRSGENTGVQSTKVKVLRVVSRSPLVKNRRNVRYFKEIDQWMDKFMDKWINGWMDR